MPKHEPHVHRPSVYVGSLRSTLTGLTAHRYRCACGESIVRLTHPVNLGLSVA